MSATYWSWETFFNAFPIILEGLKITLGLTIASYLLAMVAGFVWLILESTPVKPFNFIVYWIKEFIRSTPPIVQIFFLYFAWPMVPYVGTSFTPFVAAMLALGIHFSTYISEVYRSGIESVDKGQWEASTALNFSTRDKWTKIVLPQALPADDTDARELSDYTVQGSTACSNHRGCRHTEHRTELWRADMVLY